MKKLSAILVMILLLAMTVMPVSAAECTVNASLVANKASFEAGEEIVLAVNYTPASQQLCAASVKITFDESMVEYVGFETVTNKSSFLRTTGTASNVVLIEGTEDEAYWQGTFMNVKFKALADVSGKAEFDLDVYALDDVDFNVGFGNADYYECISTGTSVTIGSTPEPPVVEEFEISATTDGGNVVVTAENIDKAVGEGIKVYVATYAGGVLVNCQEQALVEGPMTFTGLADASAQVFVWDNQNVPVANVTIQ